MLNFYEDEDEPFEEPNFDSLYRLCPECGEYGTADDYGLGEVCLDCSGDIEWYFDGREWRRHVYSQGNAPKNARQMLISIYDVCLKCGSDASLSVDHIVPVSLGGKHDWENLQLLCQSCNSTKGNRNKKDYRPFITKIVDGYPQVLQ